MVDEQGFREMLVGREVPEDEIETAIELVTRFEASREIDGAPAMREAAWAFSRRLSEEGLNTQENYVTLARYGLFTRSDELFVAILELLDGAEAQPNLYARVGEVFGDKVRDEVFAGIGVAPLGLPTSDKPGAMHPVVQRLEAKVGAEACRALLGDSLRDLPDEYYVQDQERFAASRALDAYLQLRKQAFIERLEACRDEGRLFFAQEIDDDVIDFVKSVPEMGGGRREGNVIYETKIPFLTKQYLTETDPVLKRYYYCHCPWAREGVKNGDVTLAPTFCNCSAGFHKKPWTVIYGERVRAEVLESVLMGDERCRFAIRLPIVMD